jgi:hypothetical protein
VFDKESFNATPANRQLVKFSLAMFEKSLQDLVKGIRNIKGDVGPFISKAIAEIKDELKSRDILVKTQALQKMTYVRGASCHLSVF